jgi:hydrogenase maturation protease
MSQFRVLVAGVGNIFLGDDAFGVEVVRRLSERKLPNEVRIVDFGIRGLDLTYALLEDYESVILVDAVPRGGRTGTLYVIEPTREEAESGDQSDPLIETHNMDPVRVLRLAEAMGGHINRLLVVGCEPSALEDLEEMQTGLSDPVRMAVDKAVPLVEELVERILGGESIAPNLAELS